MSVFLRFERQRDLCCVDRHSRVWKHFYGFIHWASGQCLANNGPLLVTGEHGCPREQPFGYQRSSTAQNSVCESDRWKSFFFSDWTCPSVFFESSFFLGTIMSLTSCCHIDYWSCKYIDMQHLAFLAAKCWDLMSKPWIGVTQTIPS